MPPVRARAGSEEIPESSCLRNGKIASSISRSYEIKERFKHVVAQDLSNGLELYPITVFNSHKNKCSVPPFEYIKTIEMFPNYQRTPLVCPCKDGCDEKCACIDYPFREDIAEPAYDNEVLSDKMPVDWADNSPIIWECSEDCACGPECPTRCAQLGLRWKLEVYQTSKKGWGVRAIHTIPKGSFIAEYAGVMKVATDDDAITDNNWYSFEIASEQGATNFYIDATKKGNVSRFFNHSCNPNMFAVHVFYDDNNPVTGMHICFFAKREIKGERYYTVMENGVEKEVYHKGEEMTFDYGAGYWAGKHQKNIGCECSEKNCRFRLKKAAAKRKSIIAKLPGPDRTPHVYKTILREHVTPACV